MRRRVTGTHHVTRRLSSSMSSPYFPPPPHSTPQHYALTTPRPPRQPVVNPYEKFTQADFDHWIGGITGALRKALGHEPDEPESVPTVFEHHENESQELPDDNEYASEGDGVNDSLADIRARHVSRLDKGKARDPMEGPGLSTWGKGNKGTPIEIDFGEDGSPDEDALDDEEVVQHLSFVHDSDEEEAEDAEEQLSDQWLLPQSSLRTRTDDASDQETGEEEEDESASSASYGDERLSSDDVIEVLSSDEEPGEVQKNPSEDEHGSSEDEDLGESAEEDEGSESVERDEEEGVDAYFSVSGSAQPDGLVHADDEDDELEESRSIDEKEEHEEEDAYEEEGSDDAEEEYDEPHPSIRDGQSPSREIITLDSDEEEDQFDDEADAIQPPDRDTGWHSIHCYPTSSLIEHAAFPPHSSDKQTRIEIRDPWLGPRTYAEDFYSGGPVLPSPGAALTAHHLGANDDAGFLTPDVVTPAESNERETSGDEEQGNRVSHMPHLEFVLGHDPPAVAAYDVTMESDNDDHMSHSSPSPVEGDAKITHFTLSDAEEAVNRDNVQQQDHPTIALISEDNTKVSLPPQDGQEEARQAEDDLDRAYEEMDAEVERESHAEDSLRQFEQQNEPSLQLPTGLGSSTVTVEEVPDEEASDREEEEEALILSPAVVPLGTSDLDVDIEPMLSDEGRPEDIFSHLLEAEEQEDGEVVVHAEGKLLVVGRSKTLWMRFKDEPAAGTQEQAMLEVTDTEEAELGQPLDVIEHEALGSPSADDPSVLVGLEEFPDDAAAQTPVFPPADFVDNAVELELGQQQLPTPPAEQEAVLHRSPVRHPSPEPEVLLDTTATEYTPLPTAEDEVDTEQAASSPLDQEVSEVQAKPLFGEGADEIDSTEDITHHASLFEAADEIDSMEDITHQVSLLEEPSNKIDTTEYITHQAPLFEEASDEIDSTEDIMHQASLFEEAADEIDSTEDVMHQASLEHETSSIIAGFGEEFANPTSILDAVGDDIAVQDVTDNSDAVPDDWRGIVEEVASKAPSEEPFPHDEQESPGVYSKEGSIVSLAVTDGSIASGAMSYDVEVLMDGVTDDDADGEVDPDTSLTQDGELKDLAGEIFKDDWWTSDVSGISDLVSPLTHIQTCHKPSLEGVRTDHTAVKRDEDNLSLDDRVTAQGSVEEADPPVAFTDQDGDEEDIASSRETSPSPEAHQPTRSPSPTVDPKELMIQSELGAPATPEDSPESEKALYGGAEANSQVQTRENSVENMASETLLVIETMTTPPEEASPTIPGLTLTASMRLPSPIPGLGAHLSGETVIEVADSEIPGLTWSKMVSSSAHVSYGSSSISGGPLRSPSFPQVVPSTLTTLSTSSAAFHVSRRSATEQGLFPDPYPYSLSTPGLDSVKDEGEDTDEELEEQDMSMSSSSATSTAEKDIIESLPENDKEENKTSETPLDHEAQEIHEPIDGDQVDLDAAHDTAQLAGTDDVFTSGDVDQDRDADGDLDPDFLQFPDNVAADKGMAPTELMQEPLIFTESAVPPEAIDVSPDLDIKDFIESPDLSDEAINEQQVISLLTEGHSSNMTFTGALSQTDHPQTPTHRRNVYARQTSKNLTWRECLNPRRLPRSKTLIRDTRRHSQLPFNLFSNTTNMTCYLKALRP